MKGALKSRMSLPRKTFPFRSTPQLKNENQIKEMKKITQTLKSDDDEKGKLM